ncbi:MAG: hypothetical protein QM766_09005 [Burkholderiaceae bacterium]
MKEVFTRWYRRMGATLGLVATIGWMTGCGGGGAGGQGGADSIQNSSGASSIQVGASSPTIGSSAAKTVDIVATVKNASNVALKGQPVTFSTTDAGVTLGVESSTTDNGGVVTAKLTLNDPTMRPVIVKATSGTVEGSVEIKVVGTVLTISGAPTVGFGSSTSYVVAATNSDGTPMAGAQVSLTSAKGNSISPATATTSASGQAAFNVTGSADGLDTLTATALGASASTAVTVSGNQIRFDTPVALSEALVNTTHPVRVTYLVNGAPQVGANIELSTTRGVLGGTLLTTDATGSVETTIASATAGIATITATASGDKTLGSLQFEFVSRTPAALALQASPTTVAVNAGESSNSSTLLARVRDASGNPVKGVRVDFSAIADPSNGYISPAFATTNSSGVASTAFVAGPNSSGSNQVKVQATVASTAISSTAALTVASQALSVRVHTGNKLYEPNGETYVMPYTAAVTDSAGNPVSGATITVSYTPMYFYKGYYTAGTDGWVSTVVQQCVSEDANGDGTLNVEAGEDVNHNGQLDPGTVATVFVAGSDFVTPMADARTDASGFAQIGIKYSRGYANWYGLNLMVTITAPSGTETVTNTLIPVLPALASDIGDKTKYPPGGVKSIFGVAPGCDNTN